jgi:hypothetical protein
MEVPMRYLLILLLTGCAVDSLNKACPLSCYDGPGYTEGVGVCVPGKPVCDADMNVISCEGQVLPSNETCDGQDNNCNGVADELIYPVHHWDFWEGRYGLQEYPCKFLGACEPVVLGCIEGAWQCSYYNAEYAELGSDLQPVENETKCDGQDGDCDGIVDEDVFDNLPSRFCYSGNPIETAAHEPCHPGLLQCINGETVCTNEKTPSYETCDGVDNDCNGIVDDTGDVLSEQYDIVFIIDTSGSMAGTISAVATALWNYVDTFSGNPNYQFALVVMSANGPAPYVEVRRNFSDISTIQSSIASLMDNGASTEASLDSMYLVADKGNNSLGLNWREDANGLFFAFTDEGAQSYLSPVTTGQAVIDACLTYSVLPFVWGTRPVDFAYIPNSANGLYFTLVADANQILADLNSIIVTLCGQ